MGPDIVLDTLQSLTLSEAIKSLPPRPATDKLLSVYFNSKHSHIRTCSPCAMTMSAKLRLLAIIHSGKFLREVSESRNFLRCVYRYQFFFDKAVTTTETAILGLSICVVTRHFEWLHLAQRVVIRSIRSFLSSSILISCMRAPCRRMGQK